MKWVEPWEILKKHGYQYLEPENARRKPTKTNPYDIYSNNDSEFNVFPDGDCQLIVNPWYKDGKYDSYYYSVHEKTKVYIVKSIKRQSSRIKAVSHKRAVKHLLKHAFVQIKAVKCGPITKYFKKKKI